MMVDLLAEGPNGKSLFHPAIDSNVCLVVIAPTRSHWQKFTMFKPSTKEPLFLFSWESLTCDCLEVSDETARIKILFDAFIARVL